jgi:Ca2+-binding RTX toxin-like protein
MMINWQNVIEIDSSITGVAFNEIQNALTRLQNSIEGQYYFSELQRVHGSDMVKILFRENSLQYVKADNSIGFDYVFFNIATYDEDGSTANSFAHFSLDILLRHELTHAITRNDDVVKFLPYIHLSTGEWVPASAVTEFSTSAVSFHAHEAVGVYMEDLFRSFYTDEHARGNYDIPTTTTLLRTPGISNPLWYDQWLLRPDASLPDIDTLVEEVLAKSDSAVQTINTQPDLYRVTKIIIERFIDGLKAAGLIPEQGYFYTPEQQAELKTFFGISDFNQATLEGLAQSVGEFKTYTVTENNIQKFFYGWVKADPVTQATVETLEFFVDADGEFIHRIIEGEVVNYQTSKISLFGANGANTLLGYDGVTELYGSANAETWDDGAPDHLNGGAGVDYLDGGEGNDSLSGGAEDAGTIGIETLKGGAGMAPSEVYINHVGNDLVIRNTYNPDDRLIVRNWYLDPAHRVDHIAFADGTIWDQVMIEAHINLPPETCPDGVSGNEDTDILITAATLTANDTDPNSNGLTITQVSNAVRGTVALNPEGNVVFTPAPDFTGLASFTYTVSDGRGLNDTGAVTVNVQNVPDAPVANPDVIPVTMSAALGGFLIPGSQKNLNKTDEKYHYVYK